MSATVGAAAPTVSQLFRGPAIPAAERLRPIRHLYLHIPFCVHKCGYCDFNAYAGMSHWIEPYMAALCTELELALCALPFRALRSVYLGGGTPSLVEPEQLAGTLDLLRSDGLIAPGCEITLEANPSTVSLPRARGWHRLGVNRVSLGVQSFDAGDLRVLERMADGSQVASAVSAIRSAGIERLNLDLIYGVPGQTPRSWSRTLEQAVQLNPQHLSCYCLAVEPRTRLARQVGEGRLVPLGSDLEWELATLTRTRLAQEGYLRYEISNWCRPGSPSRHNLAYWRVKSVYGAGAGAHSCLVSAPWRWHRTWNVSHPRAYIAAASRGLPTEDGEIVGGALAMAEKTMLGLRTCWGVHLGNHALRHLGSPLEELYQAGLVDLVAGRWRSTARGLDLHNQVAMALLP